MAEEEVKRDFPLEKQGIRYFIMRSNTELNLRLCMENSKWSTQPKNVDILNTAYETSEQVVLFYSICQSFHYQGYALMDGLIGDPVDNNIFDKKDKKKWSGYFPVKWQVIVDTPFRKANNILNPWNGNRSVKFSRDGQELPTNVGAKLRSLIDKELIIVHTNQNGSAVLRKSLKLPNGRMAVVKYYVNGRFITDRDKVPRKKLQRIERKIRREENRRLGIKGKIKIPKQKKKPREPPPKPFMKFKYPETFITPKIPVPNLVHSDLPAQELHNNDDSVMHPMISWVSRIMNDIVRRKVKEKKRLRREEKRKNARSRSRSRSDDESSEISIDINDEMKEVLNQLKRHRIGFRNVL